MYSDYPIIRPDTFPLVSKLSPLTFFLPYYSFCFSFHPAPSRFVVKFIFFSYLTMTTDGLFTVCGHRLRVWWGVRERRATPNVYIFNWSRDVPSHLTKMQNSLSGVISCLLIIIYHTIISSCPFHAYVRCLFTGQSIGKSIGLIVQ